MRKIYIYDTTLRDGSQSAGISFSVKDKMRIASKLDELGVDFIEGGWPGANPREVEFFKEAKKSLKLSNSKLVAFGSTRRAETEASKDRILMDLLKAETEYVTIFGKSWDLHVEVVFKTTLKENLNMIEESVKFLKKKNRHVFFDAEHFFDGYDKNPAYAVEALNAALNGGAEFIILCDTNGGAVTSRVFEVVEEVREKIKAPLGIHTHNDGEMAVANSIAAVQAGCTQVQGTINGYGERCGNANIVSIVPALRFKLGLDCLSNITIKEFTEASRYIAEVSNMRHYDSQPYVGANAFTHKAGVHINAVMKDYRTYEHIDPDMVGNKRKMLVSDLSGKSSIAGKAMELGMKIDKDSRKASSILSSVQDMEKAGYQFELAEASLMLLMKKASKAFKRHFVLHDLRIIVEKREKGGLTSEATVKVSIDGHHMHTVAQGDGPVHAMDQALRKSLSKFYPDLKDMRLTDYSVRVLDEKEGTAAKVRVLIQTEDKNESWWTVGVSENIIEASWMALIDSFEYKFLKKSK